VDYPTLHAQTPTGEPLADDTLKTHHAALERLQERHRHELLDDDAERQELRDHIVRLRRRLSLQAPSRYP
jgi:hypothetical protein